MRDTKLARGIGWFSIGLGVAGLVAPARIGGVFGMGEHRRLARVLAVRDLIVGMGLVAQRDPAPWMRARLVAEASDAGMLAAGALTGAFDRDRAARGAVLAAGLTGVEYLLARRLSER